MDAEQILVRAVMASAGLTPQARWRRDLIGRFRVGGPRIARVHGEGVQPDRDPEFVDHDQKMSLSHGGLDQRTVRVPG